MARPALLVDVRGNAGGHISELVVEKLTRRILGPPYTGVPDRTRPPLPPRTR